MTIALTDLASAIKDYLDKEVTVDITKVTANLEPNEEGTFTLTVNNAAAPLGVKLTDLALHMTLSDPTILEFLGFDDVLGNHTSRQNASPTSPVVVNGDVAPGGEMCVFFNGDAGVLDVGLSASVEISYRALKAGKTTIRCHPHGTFKEDTLFPPNQAGANGTHDVKVLT